MCTDRALIRRDVCDIILRNSHNIQLNVYCLGRAHVRENRILIYGQFGYFYAINAKEHISNVIPALCGGCPKAIFFLSV